MKNPENGSFQEPPTHTSVSGSQDVEPDPDVCDDEDRNGDEEMVLAKKD